LRSECLHSWLQQLRQGTELQPCALVWPTRCYHSHATGHAHS
jgi:hypothetical protein